MTCLVGNDPLTDEENNHDINSVAGVLKLYFRGLENPLFPKERFTDLISCISKCLHYFFNKNMCVLMSVCSPASVRELTHGMIVRLLTCGCKSIIDSQCEFTVL